MTFDLEWRIIIILAILDFRNGFNTTDYDILLVVLELIKPSHVKSDFIPIYMFRCQQRISVGDRYSSYSHRFSMFAVLRHYNQRFRATI